MQQCIIRYTFYHILHFIRRIKKLLVYNVELLLGFKELLEISVKEDYYVVRRFCIK